jgi:hypothetical protein
VASNAKGSHRGDVDPAALVGVTVGGTIALLVASGPSTWLTVVVGIALLLVLVGFYKRPSPKKTLKEALGPAAAIGGAAGLAVVVIAAFPLGEWGPNLNLKCPEDMGSADCANVHLASWLALVWLVFALITLVIVLWLATHDKTGSASSEVNDDDGIDGGMAEALFDDYFFFDAYFGWAGDEDHA